MRVTTWNLLNANFYWFSPNLIREVSKPLTWLWSYRLSLHTTHACVTSLYYVDDNTITAISRVLNRSLVYSAKATLKINDFVIWNKQPVNWNRTHCTTVHVIIYTGRPRIERSQYKHSTMTTIVKDSIWVHAYAQPESYNKGGNNQKSFFASIAALNQRP